MNAASHSVTAARWTAGSQLSWASAFLFAMICGADTQAELFPEQLAVIANSASAESMLVARHYIEQRQVPEKNLIALPMPVGETIGRGDYEKSIVKPLRAELIKRGLTGSIRVLVTTFDVPLRVGAPEAEGADKQANLNALNKRQQARLVLGEAAADASRILSDKAIAKPPPDISDEQLLLTVDREFKAGAQRIKDLKDPTGQRQGNEFLGALIQRINGVSGIVTTLKPANPAGPNEVLPLVAELSKQITVAGELLRALDALPSVENRERAYAVTQGTYGAIGVLRRANNEVQLFRYEGADASVDSELSLLWWDRDMFLIQGRLPSPLHYQVEGEKAQAYGPLPVLMVSRLDGPSSEIASRLVDLAVAGERSAARGSEQLEGAVYVDARGLKPGGQAAFYKYDQNLRDIGWLIRDKTDYKVTIENHEELFESVENAALYVGWYAVHNFSGEFSFVPGAVGYHIASSEALSVRNPTEKGWCKNLLERGISATLGAVDEPYLEAFPLPSDFFGLFLTGRYSLVEAYYLTAPYISWRLALFGDPLLNPFGKRPALDPRDVKLSSATKQELPQPPSERSFPDPMVTRSQLEQKRKETQQKLDGFFENLKKNSPQPAAKKNLPVKG